MSTRKAMARCSRRPRSTAASQPSSTSSSASQKATFSPEAGTDADIAGIGGAALVRSVDHDKSREAIAEALRNCPGPVGRPVVDDDHFPVTVAALPRQRAKLVADHVGSVPAWDNHADGDRAGRQHGTSAAQVSHNQVIEFSDCRPNPIPNTANSEWPSLSRKDEFARGHCGHARISGRIRTGRMMRNCQARQLIVAMAAVAFVPAVPGSAAAQTRFHVDASAGSDSNDGLAPDRAWKSLAKVNEAQLSPATASCSARGETWTGPVVLKWSGRPAQPDHDRPPTAPDPTRRCQAVAPASRETAKAISWSATSRSAT